MSNLHFRSRWDPFRDFRREVSRLFDGFEPMTGSRVPHGTPAVNLYDAGDHYLLTVRLPGVGPDEVALSLAGESLTIRGERRRPDGVAEDAYRRQERPIGRWARTVTLPDRVNADGVAASFVAGILSVSLPKAEEAKPRRINVATAPPT